MSGDALALLDVPRSLSGRAPPARGQLERRPRALRTRGGAAPTAARGLPRGSAAMASAAFTPTPSPVVAKRPPLARPPSCHCPPPEARAAAPTGRRPLLAAAARAAVAAAAAIHVCPSPDGQTAAGLGLQHAAAAALPASPANGAAVDPAAAAAAVATTAAAARVAADCRPYLDALGASTPRGGRPPLAFRGASPPAATTTTPAGGGAPPAGGGGLPPGMRRVHPAPDLLDDATYGAAGAAFFGRLERALTAAGARVTPSVGHILTGGAAAAAAWGTPVTVWPVGRVGYVWWAGPGGVDVYAAGDEALGERPGGGVVPSEAAAAAAFVADLAAAKGPPVVGERLADALAAGREVLFAADGGWWELPTDVGTAVAHQLWGEEVG